MGWWSDIRSTVIGGVVGAAIPGVGPLLGAGIGMAAGSSKKMSEKGVDAQKRATAAEIQGLRESIAASEAAEERARADVEPWRTAGVESLNVLGQKMEAGPGEFDPTKQPGYEYGYKEFIEKPWERRASAMGLSGGSLKALEREAQDYAGLSHRNWLDDYYRSLDPHFKMAGLGGGAAGQTAQNVLQTGTQVGGAESAIGTTRGSGYIDRYNIKAAPYKAGVEALSMWGLSKLA